MNLETYKKFIVLIGPACVGKSLIADALSKKTGYKRICFDDLYHMASEEYSFNISPKMNEEKFKKRTAKDLRRTRVYKKNALDKEHLKEESRLIEDYIKTYKQYCEMFGSLFGFEQIVSDELLGFWGDDIEGIYVRNEIALKTLATIVDEINEPLIIDVPAWFGWKISNEEIKNNKTIKFRKLQKDVLNMQKEMQNALKLTNSVFLYPGLDYHARNAMYKDKLNNIILNSLDNYVDCANIMIDISGLFNDKYNECFSTRRWFDSHESLEKEKRKNKGNIANICDEIMIKVEENEEMEK